MSRPPFLSCRMSAELGYEAEIGGRREAVFATEELLDAVENLVGPLGLGDGYAQLLLEGVEGPFIEGADASEVEHTAREEDEVGRVLAGSAVGAKGICDFGSEEESGTGHVAAKGIVLDDDVPYVQSLDSAKGSKRLMEGGGGHFAGGQHDANGARDGRGKLAGCAVGLVEELADKAHAILQLGEAFVVAGAGGFAAGLQVPLVGEEGEVGADFTLEPLLPGFDLVDQRGYFLGVVGAQVQLDLVVAVTAEAGQAHGDDADGLDVRVEGREVGDGAVEVVAVVDVGANDQLGMDLDAHIAQALQLGEHVGDVGVAQQAPAHFEVGGVDGDVDGERRSSAMRSQSFSWRLVRVMKPP